MRNTKWVLTLLLFVGIVFSGTNASALEEIEDNDLDIKIQRIERGEETVKKGQQKNDERLFNEHNRKKLAESQKLDISKQKQVADSLFTVETVSVSAHDPNKLFRNEEISDTYQAQDEEIKHETNFLKENRLAILLGMGIICVGFAGIYFYMKSR